MKEKTVLKIKLIFYSILLFMISDVLGLIVSNVPSWAKNNTQELISIQKSQFGLELIDGFMILLGFAVGVGLFILSYTVYAFRNDFNQLKVISTKSQGGKQENTNEKV